MSATVTDGVPVLGADVTEGQRIPDQYGNWSSAITHFVDLPADYWGTRTYGWTRVAYAGDRPIRPIVPDEMLAVRVAVRRPGPRVG